MPQDSLLPSDPRYTGLTITVLEVVKPQGITWAVQVRRQLDGHDWKTVHVSEWEGVMLDVLPGTLSDATSAFLWGERRDLAHAVAAGARDALRHLRRFGG